MPIKKPTQSVLNSKLLAEELSQRCRRRNGRCSDNREHQQCIGKHARRAAVYPEDLGLAILNVIMEQIKGDGIIGRDGVVTLPLVRKWEEYTQLLGNQRVYHQGAIEAVHLVRY